jgi:hypothetical protein
MNEIENAIKVLEDCYKHPSANAAIAGLRAMLAQREPLSIDRGSSGNNAAMSDADIWREIAIIPMPEPESRIHTGGGQHQFVWTAGDMRHFAHAAVRACITKGGK